ncbi:two-component regulator propeller domain-containing protein [Pelagicoccus sp. SDUM812003]|uniref:two-component regulator propeller domain-containing protein n=1 Tax=Pelagicoccus sp. SDUM812003 TaxID=3041267 RepID=UPI0028101C29|nr:two-component regulator propeller domain-containing protein [Pelagicoccus sp. SDUM812003]MDQ8202179.1 two-component regulator propeller domain-containing protein [Pelagicoccus sp. SDUM812003]
MSFPRVEKICPVRQSLLAIGSALACLLFSQTAWAIDPAREIHQYNCQTWTRQNGLPANGINAVTQTIDGYLWLGTQSGLVRFDGVRFASIDLPDEARFPSRLVSSLDSSRTGGLWFGLTDGGFGYRDAKGEFFRPDSSIWPNPHLDVASICELNDGSLWVGTSYGLIKHARENPGADIFDNQLHNVRWVREDAQKRIWLMTVNEGLHYWQDGELNPFPDTWLTEHLHSAAVVDHQGRVWVGGTQGLRCYDAGFQRLEIPPFTHDLRFLFVDRNGVLWIGTTTQGLACYKNGVFSFLRQDDGLANNFVTSIFEDREGSLWVGTREGLNQLSDVKFPIYSEAQGVLGGLCHGVSAAANGGLWISTSRGLTHFDGRNATNYTEADGLFNNYTKRTFEARNGDVYLINGRQGIDILSEGVVVANLQSDSWPTAFAEDSQGVIVSVAGTLRRVSREGFAPYEIDGQAPLQIPWIRDLLTSRDGALWVASVDGILRIKDGTVRKWTTEDGLVNHDAYSLCEDNQGIIWAGLRTGIGRIKDDRIKIISRSDGLLDDTVYAIVPDDLGSLWFNSSQGIFRVSLKQLNDFADGKRGQVTSEAFNAQNMIKTIDTAEVEFMGCKTADGRIWFPTPLGAVAIDPANIPVNQVAPPVHIERVRANSRELAVREAQKVPPGPGELEFHFTAPSFVAPEKTRFRYQLEGYDPDWVETENRRQAFYTNLKPGRYNFRVTAANADGVWNSQATVLGVVLQPHFYQATWFFILSSCVGLGGLVGAYRWRVSVLHRREQELQENRILLENEVRHRTAELESANRELEAFSYSVSHDLRAPLRHVDGYVDLLVSRCRDGLSEKCQHYLDTIASSVNRMGILIDDLLHFSRTGRIEIKLRNLDMNKALQLALDELAESCEGRSIKWVIGTLPPVEGDLSLIRQVWVNLLGNAIKYTRNKQNARIEVSSRMEDGKIVFTVSDNGAGFDMRYADRLFGVFQRMHSEDEFEGTGIGLALVHRIVTRHGGRVWAESEVGKGATFHFTLPRAR